jgi:RNA polymerase sigma factor (sigma-70 family)
MPATALRVPLPRVRLARLSDDRLASLAAAGDERAFEVIYDRHHGALLGFCRHMLGSREEGEDALQQTFLRAHRSLVLHGAPEDVRPWLFAIARNRCRSIHAARKDAASPDDQLEPSTDGLAADVEQRSDLRALLADIEQLPEDQRSALVLAELADLPHQEIGTVIGVPANKVKALVHQARTHLIAEREARETPCEEIREQLANARGGELRRGPLRRHLNRCEPCSAYRKAVADQRIALGLLLPVIPSAGLKDAVLGAIGAGGGGGAAAAAAGGAAGAASAASGGGTAAGLGAKLAIGAALIGGAGGSAAIVETAVVDHPGTAGAKKHAPQATTNRPAATKAHGKVKLVDASTGSAKRDGARKGEATRTRTRTRGEKAAEKPGERKAHAYGKERNGNNGERNQGAAAEENSNGQGLALGRNDAAGTRGTSRSTEVQQRNADRKAAKVPPVKPVTPAPKTPAPQSTSPQGKAKGKAPAALVPLASPEPVATEAPSSKGKSHGKSTADPVAETLTP